MENRNLSQFWIFQNKELAINGSAQLGLMPKDIDARFNMRTTYIIVSDATRHFGDTER